MVKCVVQCCKNDTRKHNKKNCNITFHRFPKDQNLAKKWIEAIKNSDWKPNVWSKICSIHFPDSSLYETKNGLLRKLADNAVPSRFLHKAPTSGHTSTITRPPTPPTSDTTEALRKPNLKQEVIRLKDLAKRRRLRCNTLYAALRRLRRKLNSMTQVIKELKKEKLVKEEQEE